MRRLHSLLGPLLVAGATLAVLPAVGCYAETRTRPSGYVIDDVPPAREEVVIYRPGYIWVQGHWTLGPGRRWVWRGGYYERERPSYVYVQGRWERRGDTYIWIDGGWRPRGRVVVRSR
jgi:hypothetical protein